MITRQKTEQRHRVENEMCGIGEHEVWRQRHEVNRREVAMERSTRMARANRETRPYVVRDLSWELARYLDTESFSESASATSDSTNGNERRSG
jgi:hypothetical protein